MIPPCGIECQLPGGGLPWHDPQVIAPAVHDGVPVAPDIMTGATDSRHFMPIADAVLRFRPYREEPADLVAGLVDGGQGDVPEAGEGRVVVADDGHVRGHAQAKARSVADQADGRPVLGVDTTVVCGSRVFAKATGPREAAAMLEALGELALEAARCLLMPFLRRPSYCLPFLTLDP